MDMKLYWSKIRAEAERLPDPVTLISVETAQHKAGSVVTVSRDVGAQRIVDRTHRIATEAEIKAHQERVDAKLEWDRQRELRRQPVTRLVPVAQEFGPPLVMQQSTRGKTGAASNAAQ